MTINIFFTILITSLATYLSRFLGVFSSEKIDENSKIFKWFNCLAYSTLASLIARIVIFPNGYLNEADLILRIFVIFFSVIIFYLSKKNLVYPTITSSILLAFLLSI